MTPNVTVYLDSQDFSRLSPSHADYASMLPIREELLSLKRGGLATFVFTDIHVFESLPTHPRQSGKGLERVRTISEFCGTNNLPSSTSIIEHELRIACAHRIGSDWKEWYPDFDLDEPDLRNHVQDAIDEIACNRKQRRAMKRAMSKPLSGNSGREFAAEIVAKYPFMKDGRQTLELWASGKAEWGRVVEQLKIGLRDIVAFSEWLSNNWEHGAKFVGNLRAGNAGLKETLITLYQRMRDLFENHPEARSKENAGDLRRIYIEQRKAFFASFVEKNAPRILELGEESTPFGTLSSNTTPSLYSALTFLTEVAYKSALPDRARNPNHQVGSDFVDAMHVMFLPRVDVFRADKFSCSVLNETKPPGSTLICPSLRDLPAAIHDRHRSLSLRS